MTTTRYYTGPLDSVTVVDTDLETETVVRRGDPLECSEALAARLDAQNGPADEDTHWAKTARHSAVKAAREIPRPLHDTPAATEVTAVEDTSVLDTDAPAAGDVALTDQEV